MKKKVLHLIGSFYQGGSERQAVNLVKLLNNEGSYNVFAATLNNAGVLRAEIETVGLPDIPEFPLTSFYDVNFVCQVRRCVKYLRDNKIDIVHTHDFYTNIFGMTAARIAGVPVRIASKRETGGMRSGTQKLIEKIAFGQAHAIIANSTAVCDYLTESAIKRDKVHIIYNGIDVDQFDIVNRDRASTCNKLGIPHDKNICFITIVANLRHCVKNVPMHLRAAKRVIENQRDVHFVIAGEGELEAQLQESARLSGIADNVHFIGRCDDVPALLGVSYACVLTSTAEGFSNSILEYMAAGKPVVATNVGGASEAIIDGETGFVVASNDDEAMANHLIGLLNDRAKGSAFGAKGRLIVDEKFSQQSQLQATLALYNSLLTKNN
ncbi:MAG: glycosyltransferase [Chloracidobacterium sp.]|nr:glycosyltransferase [Chloracidobacterium sp.]